MNKSLAQSAWKARVRTVGLIHVLASVLLLTSGTAHASTSKLNKTVTFVAADTKAGGGGGAIYIQISGGQSGEGCGSDAWAIIPIGASYPAFAQQQSIALAAFLSGRQVDVALSGCAAAWSGSTTFPLVTSISIH